MVATQSFSISRRALDVEDYIDIGRRHAGWIAGPTFFGLVVSVCVAFVIPNEYMSRATMQIQPAQISDSVVQSTISASLNDRINQMETSIMSRSQLSTIIYDPRLQLYKDELKTKAPEDVIDEMKNAIKFDFIQLPGALSKRATAFNITFTYSDRFKAQQTVQSLISKFDEQNENTQKTDQDAIKGTVGDLLNKAKADLQAATESLTAFKEANAGKLPEQVQLNVTREAGYTAKIQSDTDQIFHDRQQITTLDAARDQVRGRLENYDQEQASLQTLMQSPNGPGQENPELVALDKQIDQAEFNLAQLHREFTDKYPPLKGAQIQLDGLKSRRVDLVKKLQAKATTATAADKAGDEAKTMASIKQVEYHKQIDEQLKQIDSNEKLLTDDIVRLQAEQAGYKKDSADVDQMLKDSTGLEGQYEELRTAKEMAETTYLDWEKKQQLADASGQLIERKVGEILEVLDPPNIPIAPTKPNRYAYIGGGFALSIILGFAMAGLREAKDTSLKNLKDVRAYTNLPVLCSIPLLENTMLVKRKRRLTYLAWTAAVIVGAACVSGTLVYYFTYILRS